MLELFEVEVGEANGAYSLVEEGCVEVETLFCEGDSFPE